MRITLTFLFSLLLLLGAHQAQAQLSQGTRYFSTFSTSRGGLLNPQALSVHSGLAEIAVQTESSLATFSFTPEYGVFLSDHFLLGGGFLFSSFTDFDGNSATILGLLPFARYYFNPAAANSHFFAQAQLGLVASLDEGGDEGFPFNIGAGLTHFLAPGLALDTYLALSDGDLSSDGDASIGLGVNLNLYLDNDLRANRRAAVSGVGRGSLMVGGTTGNFVFGLSDGGGTNISLMPSAAYFVTDKLAVGAGILLDFFRRDNGFFESSNTRIGFTPQVRYYLSQGQHRQWFLGAGLGINRFSSKSDPGFSFSDTFLDIGVGAGMNIFLTPSAALELGPSLRYNTEAEDLRLGLDLGIQVFLNPKGTE